ncbi:FlgN protein [Nocardioides scoriae]|uniref:FlgN protein n=1 Tax=Nocardioides scoriae TaxID=642780 RepID=A0A1H1S4R7_9ACTN|nr:flagellar protein FlgN [Nocardioides scoriae]SDS42992.1 FlgN protein [Nocardioides scoriae]
MDKLSQILWRERELMESLLFKLEVEQLVVSSGRTRWLARSAEEVEMVLGLLRETEVLRAVVSDEAAESVGLPPDASLRDLAAAAQEPWSSILDDHRTVFQALGAEIAALAQTNRELLTAGLRSARETLLSFESAVTGYAADGAAVAAGASSSLVDRSL